MGKFEKNMMKLFCKKAFSIFLLVLLLIPYVPSAGAAFALDEEAEGGAGACACACEEGAECVCACAYGADCGCPHMAKAAGSGGGVGEAEAGGSAPSVIAGSPGADEAADSPGADGTDGSEPSEPAGSPAAGCAHIHDESCGPDGVDCTHDCAGGPCPDALAPEDSDGDDEPGAGDESLEAPGGIEEPGEPESLDSFESLTPLASYIWNSSAVPTVTSGDVVTISGAPSGAMNIPAGATVIIEGEVTGTAAGITLNIGAGATVRWRAMLIGSTAAGTYLATLTGPAAGAGAFIMEGASPAEGSKIANMGAGGALNINGPGLDVTIGSGGSVFSDTRGNPVRVNGNNVTVNVNAGGLVESLANNSTTPNAGIQVENAIQNARININGGSVVSSGPGYAINDGGGTGTVSNNTIINVTGGLVSAIGACAIHSTGSDSVTNVSGGLVSNAATNNLNPAINMNAGSGINVIISGGTVESRSNPGWAVQTKGDVSVTGGLVTAVNGRAINLAGMNSKATVTGGVVEATGSGTAVSTSTTALNEIVNASVVVTGGTVVSSAGYAINVAGLNSSVTVTGGSVSSAGTASAGHAINATSDAANAAITVTGGTVSATRGNGINAAGANAGVAVSGTGSVSSDTGHGINASGQNATVTVSGGTVSTDAMGTTSSAMRHAINAEGSSPNITVSGGQVTARMGRAVNAGSAGAVVTVTGDGLVFAYGTKASDVVNNPLFTAPALGTFGLLVAWDRANSSLVYPEAPSSRQDLFSVPADAFLIWVNDETSGRPGFWYLTSAGLTFLAIDEVRVVSDYGLIFDASTGRLHLNVNGSGNPADAANIEYTYNKGVTWNGAVGALTLNGFSWYTGAPAALTIANGPAAIVLENGTDNTFYSAGLQAGLDSFGLYSPALDTVTIRGNGTLTASSESRTGPGSSTGLKCGNLVFERGTLIAQGNTRALDVSGLTGPAYRYWRNSNNADPGGEGRAYGDGAPAPHNTPYTPNLTDKYVKIAAAPFAIVSDGTITGLTGIALETPVLQTAAITIVGVQLNAALSNTDVSGWFSNLPAGVSVRATAPAGGPIALSFSGAPLGASTALFDITIPGSRLVGGAPLNVFYNPAAGFNITSIYDLLVISGKGGSVSTATPTGKYRAGDPISVNAVPDKGYSFKGWTVSGVSISANNRAKLLVGFRMPAGRVILTAVFVRIASTPVEKTEDPGVPAGEDGGGGGDGGNSGDGGDGDGVSGDDGSDPPEENADIEPTRASLLRTGDDGNPLGWLFALVASALSIIYLAKVGAINNTGKGRFKYPWNLKLARNSSRGRRPAPCK